MLLKDLPKCPVDTTLMMMNSRWKVLIIKELLTGTKRFGELKRALCTITQKVLASNLREMEENGLVERKVFPEVPPRVEYSLTETGLSLKSVLSSLAAWGTEYRKRI